MAFNFSAKGGIDRKAIARNLHNAQKMAAREVVRKVEGLVVDKIPNHGWYRIYRQAIRYFHSARGTQWLVSGLWPAPLTEFPAETTLILFDSRAFVGITATVGNVFVKGNPWPIDQIPAISGGITLDVIARPATKSDVQKRREALQREMPDIIKGIQDAGGQIVDEFPIISGRTYADIVYMAKALEHGLAGLQRIPHWHAAYREAQNKKGEWIAAIDDDLKSAVAGDLAPSLDGERLPAPLARKLRRSIRGK